MTQQRPDPAAQRWLLGGEVATVREKAGLSLSQVAKATGISKPKLGQLERGTYNVAPDELRRILEACSASSEQLERLRDFATQPKGRPWWFPWRSIVADWFGLFLGLEGMAKAVSAFELSAVPGPLQTPDYARAVTAVASMVRPTDLERHIDLRMERAKRFTDDEAVGYAVVIEEAVLHRTTGVPATMRSQLDHLLQLSERPNLDIRVLPVSRAVHPAMTVAQYVLFEFHELSAVAYAEVFGGAMYTRQDDRIRSYREAARHLAEAALPPEATRDLILALRRGSYA